MKILFVNESTIIKGGVDSVLEMEMEGLSQQGINVGLFEVSHSESQNKKPFEKVKDLHLYFSERKKIQIIKEKIESFNPDIVHFHNTYPFLRRPLWSDDFFKSIRVVQHLHNYYPFCLNSFFFSEGQICTECYMKNSFLPGIKNSCYDYSKLKSFLTSYNRPIPTEWIEHSKNVNLFLGVSQFVVEKYVEFGVEGRIIKKLYNGISRVRSSDIVSNGNYVLFLGNVVYSKGVEIVCELAKRNVDIEFKVAGFGRDLKSIKKRYNALSNLTFTGYVEGIQKEKLINNCKMLLFPAQSWESFGLVILEALASGKPVVTSELGGISELVENGVTGFLVKENDIISYEKVIRNLWEKLVPFVIDIEKQKEIISEFSQDMHIKNLVNYYKSII